MKDSKKLIGTSFFTIIVLVVCFVALSAATYAWFTSNKTVNTDRVTSKTDSQDIRLLLSRNGGAAFSGSDEVDISPVSSKANEALIPVSTDDLKNFAYLRVGDATSSKFDIAKDESYYYHETIYVRAVSDVEQVGTYMALYLNNEDPLVEADEKSLLLNAARLGLVFDDASPMIFYLSEDSNTSAGAERINNTFLGGVQVAEGNVLQVSNGNIRAVSDPAKSLEKYAIGSGEITDATPIAYLEWNTTYKLDIYFYIEGCDPDCSNDIQRHGASLWLDFYGAVQEKTQ